MSLSYAILATLADRPCSGYDIAKQFDGAAGLVWQAAPQQIYRELTEWIAQPCKPSPTKDELLVKLLVGHLVDPYILVTELKRHRQLHQANLLVYRDLEQQYCQNPQQLPIDAKCQYLILHRWICYEDEWLAWCQEAIKLLTEDAPLP